MLNPFFLFQIFSITVWSLDGYEKYAMCILACSIYSVLEQLYETVKNTRNIREMVKYTCKIQVIRVIEGKREKIAVNSEELVPGDLILVPDNCLMPCDAILLKG